MSCLDRRTPYLSSTMARMVGLELLTTPVGATEVMMIVRLEPPRPPDLLLPGPLRLLRLLTRFQLPRSDVNVVAGAGRWSAPPLLSESDNQTANEKAKQEWPGSSQAKRSQACEPDTRHGARARTGLTLRPSLLYHEGPSLPARLAVSVIVLGVGLYLDRVSARGKAPGRACQAAAGPPIAEPLRLPVEVHVYIVPGQVAAIHGLNECLDGGAWTFDFSGRARRGNEDSAPRTTAVPALCATRSPPSTPSAHALSSPSQRCQCSRKTKSRAWDLSPANTRDAPRARPSCQAFSALELTWSPYHARSMSP
jgi:hypothetical protein